MKKISLFAILAITANFAYASDLTKAENYYPGGKYSIGSRYARSNPSIEKVKNNIRLTGVTTYQSGPVQLDVQQYSGDLYYERRFENHPLSVHGSWGRAASKTVNSFKGNIINGHLGVTNATINGTEFHPQHAYDAKDGGDHPYDIYTYNVSGTVTITTIREVDKPKPTPLPTPTNNHNQPNSNNDNAYNSNDKTDNQERDRNEKLYDQDDNSSNGEYDLSKLLDDNLWNDLKLPDDFSLTNNEFDPYDPNNLLACLDCPSPIASAEVALAERNLEALATLVEIGAVSSGVYLAAQNGDWGKANNIYNSDPVAAAGGAMPPNGDNGDDNNRKKTEPYYKNNKEAEKAARDNGYKPTKDFKFNSKGQKVYEKGNTQITRDLDGHNGGVWKSFDKRTGQRTGTLDKNFNRIKG